jgi:nucleotide-binding universal stress UspA family protein
MKTLVAVDGSRPSMDAVALFGRLADPERTQITVMSVAPPSTPPLPDLWMLVTEEGSEKATAETSAAAAELLGTFGHKVAVKNARGTPRLAILDTVESEGYQLIVVGSGSESWLGQHLLGSVSSHILHASPVSVMVVHRLLEHPGDKVKVVMGTDGSQGAKHAATTFARFGDAGRVRADVLSVAPHLISGMYAVPAAATVSYDEAAQREVVERARGWASDAKDFLDSQGYETAAHVAMGAVAPHLLKEAESLQSDLVVVGSRRLGALGRVFLGSTSDNIARHAPATLVAK